MSHHTANCPFLFFSFPFPWNLSFGGSGSVPPRPRPPRGPALCWRCDGTRNLCRLCCLSAVRSSEPSGVGHEEPRKRQIPGAAQDEAEAGAVLGCLAAAASPAPATDISPLFILSFPDTSSHAVPDGKERRSCFQMCPFQEKQRLRLSLGVPSSSPGSG